MRILFVTNVTDFYITREPLGLEYLSAAAINAGHETRFCDIDLNSLSHEMNRFRPEIVGYSVTTGQHQLFIRLNRKLKESFDFFAVFGGPHATFWPQMVDEDGVDAICRGEGEKAFVDFLTRYERGSEYETTPNWWVKSNSGIIRNEVRNLVLNLDSLPFPDRKSVFERFPDTRKTPVKCFVPNRGCPYNCSYCFNEAYWEIYKGKGKRVRIRSPKTICDEIELIQQMAPLRMPMFTADIFGFTKKWLEEFRDHYRSRIGLPYYCNVRADIMDDEYVRLLSESGCITAAMGIEAGNDRVRNELFCRGQTREQILNAAKSLKKHDITLITYNILGVAGTTLDADLETLELNIECKADYAGTFMLVPLPGTKIHDWIVKQKLIDPLSIDENFSYYGVSILPIENRAERGRLYYLFALAVAFPAMRHFLLRFLTVPLDPLYRLAFRIFRGWRYKRKAFPVRYGIFRTFKAAWRYLFFEHR